LNIDTNPPAFKRTSDKLWSEQATIGRGRKPDQREANKSLLELPRCLGSYPDFRIRRRTRMSRARITASERRLGSGTRTAAPDAYRYRR
jgi:hypothetical protein